MSIMYSTIAFIASAVKGHSGVSYAKRSGSVADRTFGTFNSFGTIMFAFGGQIIMPEIQVIQYAWPVRHTRLAGIERRNKHAQVTTCIQSLESSENIRSTSCAMPV